MPLTFPGVAAFSLRSSAWLFAVWSLLAATGAGAVVWFLSACWEPVLENTIQSAPAELGLASGTLSGLPETPNQHQNRFLSLVLGSDPDTLENMTSDIQIRFTQDGMEWRSLFGAWAHPYPPNLQLDLSPDTVLPWWRARRTLFFSAAFLVVAIGLILTWLSLATLYYFPLVIAAFFLDRTNACTWRLAGSALIPGAVIMTLAIVLYGIHLLNLLGLLLATALHFIAAWVFAFGAARNLPAAPQADPAGNPFETLDEAPDEAEEEDEYEDED